MSSWLNFWWVVLAVALLCYFSVAAIVSIKAFGDLRELISFLSRAHEEVETNSEGVE